MVKYSAFLIGVYGALSGSLFSYYVFSLIPDVQAWPGHSSHAASLAMAQERLGRTTPQPTVSPSPAASEIPPTSPAASADSPPPPALSPMKATPRPSPARAPKHPAAWPVAKDVLTWLAPRRFELKRSTLATLGQLCSRRFERSARITPDHERYRPVPEGACGRGGTRGWCMPDKALPALFRALGLSAGDCISEINGYKLSSPEEALELYTSHACKLELLVNRNAKSRTIHLYLVSDSQRSVEAGSKAPRLSGR